MDFHDGRAVHIFCFIPLFLHSNTCRWIFLTPSSWQIFVERNFCTNQKLTRNFCLKKHSQMRNYFEIIKVIMIYEYKSNEFWKYTYLWKINHTPTILVPTPKGISNCVLAKYIEQSCQFLEDDESHHTDYHSYRFLFSPFLSFLKNVLQQLLMLS